MKKQRFDRVCAVVANATVMFQDRGGQGVLVAHSFVLTAAHCIEYDLKGGVALGDPVLCRIRGAHDTDFVGSLEAADPCSDMAVIGQPDDQAFPREADEYEQFCLGTRPVSIEALRFSEFPAEFRVHILAYQRKWVTGKAMVFRNHQPKFAIEAEDHVRGGSSGGPVINDAGHLVGIVSSTSGVDGEQKEVMCAALPWALPMWIYKRLRREGDEHG